jgi:hypothetical protein
MRCFSFVEHLMPQGRYAMRRGAVARSLNLVLQAEYEPRCACSLAVAERSLVGRPATAKADRRKSIPEILGNILRLNVGNMAGGLAQSLLNRACAARKAFDGGSEMLLRLDDVGHGFSFQKIGLQEGWLSM